MEIYKAAYEAGNEFTINFVNTIRKVGFIFDFDSSAKNGRIHMTATPHKIFKEIDIEKFEDFLNITGTQIREYDYSLITNFFVVDYFSWYLYIVRQVITCLIYKEKSFFF